MNHEVTEQLTNYDNKIIEKTKGTEIERAVSGAVKAEINKKGMTVKQKLLNKANEKGELEDLIDL